MSDFVVAPSATMTASNRRQLAALGGAVLGFVVVALDAQIVNVALPDIGSALGGGLSGLQWVVTGYTLTFSALILFPGRCRIGSGLEARMESACSCSLRRQRFAAWRQASVSSSVRGWFKAREQRW